MFSWKSHFKNFTYHLQKLETCFFLIEELIKADNTKKIYLYKLKLKLEMVAFTESHRRCCLSGVHLCSHTTCSSYPKTEQRNHCLVTFVWMVPIVEWVEQETLTLMTLTLMPKSWTMMVEKGCSCSQDYSIVIREYSTASKAKEFNTT